MAKMLVSYLQQMQPPQQPLQQQDEQRNKVAPRIAKARVLLVSAITAHSTQLT
jgi:hypothetical protein